MPKLFDMSTDRNGRFNYAGETSADFGMIITGAPIFERPARKSQAFEVPGRNGVILQQQDAWADVSRVYNIAVAVDHAAELPAKVYGFTSWLNSIKGYQRLEDSFEPEVFRLAYYNGGGDVSNNLMQYGEAAVSFTCRPERFYKSGEIPKPLTNGASIYNPTRFNAKPLLHIEGSGAVAITLNGETITADITDYINIDCDRLDAYRLASENMNNKVAGTFPKLAPGVNTVAISGNVTAATITPRFYAI